MKRITYHIGGIIPAAPAQNRAEQWDDQTVTYTAWDAAGAQTTQRGLTPAESAALAADSAAQVAAVNVDTLRSRAQSALTANATFLALAAPTNAQILAQVKRLTKECNALIRLAVEALDDITDTA